MVKNLELILTIAASMLAAFGTVLALWVTYRSCYRICTVRHPVHLDMMAEQLLQSLGIEPDSDTATVDREAIKKFFLERFPVFVDNKETNR